MNNYQEISKQKDTLEAIQREKQGLCHDISSQPCLFDIPLGQDSSIRSDSSMRDYWDSIHQLVQEEAANIHNISTILQKVGPQLIRLGQEIASRESLQIQAGEREEQKIDEQVFYQLFMRSRESNTGHYQKVTIENLESQEIEDVVCVCDYDFEEIEKLINEEEGIKEKLKLLVLKKLVNLETKEPLDITMRGDLKKYQIVEEINIADELGEWRFHPFFDKMAVYVVRNGDQDFPVKWHVSKDFSLEIKTKHRGSSEKALSGVSQTLLSFMEEIAEKCEKDKGKAKIWVEALNEQAVKTVDDLLDWERKDFEEPRIISKQFRLIIRQELNKFKFKGIRKAQAKLSDADRQGIVHKIRRFLYYHVEEEDKLGFINQEVLELAYDEFKMNYEGESLLEQIKTFYLGYSVPMRRKGNIVLERGMILCGPPGTGKTVLTNELPLKIGLTPISHSLSASEGNRGIVGQTEKVLLDLCNRATKMPHLLCCVSIDEIESLVPRRDEKSSQHKTDGIAVLLAVIGGIKDVPNLVILATANRLNQIDDAIKRRLSGQFFVGRPSPASRKKLIQRVNNEKDEKTGSQFVVMNEKEIEETVKMTTNFSGAALKMLISKLLVYYKTQKKQGKLTTEEITQYATQTSKQFNIKLGTFYLPDLFQKRIEDKKQGLEEGFEALCTRNQSPKSMKMDPGCTIDAMLAKTLDTQENKNLKYAFTGRILVNLSDILKTSIEYQLKDELHLLVEERKVMASPLNDLLPRFADFAAERNIDFIQLFNADFLLDNNAFDEGKMMENINEKLQELGTYNRSLLLIDMDSLCGVNMGKSESVMGPKSSSSVSNPKLFNFSIHSINTKVQVKENKEIWIALACKNSFLLNLAKENLDWRKGPKQIEQENNERENNTKEKVCNKCNQKYLEVENKLGCCNYHDGFLFESSKKPEFWEPLEDEALINALKADPKVNEFGLKYICCFENYTSQGCKKDKHSEHHDNRQNYYDTFISLKRLKSSRKM